MNAPAPAPLSAERLADLSRTLEDPRFELGPLDVRDVVAALGELYILRGAVSIGPVEPVRSEIATGLREAAEAHGPGPLAERLHQSASALDVLCGTIVAALQRGDVATSGLGELLRAALVTAGAR